VLLPIIVEQEQKCKNYLPVDAQYRSVLGSGASDREGLCRFAQVGQNQTKPATILVTTKKRRSGKRGIEQREQRGNG
jgi:hypothetical protein